MKSKKKIAILPNKPFDNLPNKPLPKMVYSQNLK